MRVHSGELYHTERRTVCFVLIVKPESKSPIPCPDRPQILTLRSDQVEKNQKPNSLDWG